MLRSIPLNNVIDYLLSQTFIVLCHKQISYSDNKVVDLTHRSIAKDFNLSQNFIIPKNKIIAGLRFASVEHFLLVTLYKLSTFIFGNSKLYFSTNIKHILIY